MEGPWLVVEVGAALVAAVTEAVLVAFTVAALVADIGAVLVASMAALSEEVMLAADILADSTTMATAGLASLSDGHPTITGLTMPTLPIILRQPS